MSNKANCLEYCSANVALVLMKIQLITSCLSSITQCIADCLSGCLLVLYDY